MKKQRGFTIIKTMVTIAIIGILVSVAISAYQHYAVTTSSQPTDSQAAHNQATH